MRRIEIVMDVIGLVCLFYGIFVYRVQSGTSTFILWLVLGAFFFLLAVGLHVQIWAGMPGVFPVAGSTD